MAAPSERRVSGAGPRSAALPGFATTFVASTGLGGTAVWLAFQGGGTTLFSAAPAGIAIAAGLLVVAFGGTLSRLPTSRWSGWPALGAAVALPLVAVASLMWTQSRSLTAASTATWTVVALVFVVAALAFQGPARAAAGVAVVIAAPVVVALVIEEHLFAGDGTSLFLYSRLSYPMDYANGAAALVFVGAPAACAVASSRTVAPPVRVAAACAAGLLVATGSLALSRGGTLALAVAVVALLLAAPNRASAALVVVAVGGAFACAYPFLFDRHSGEGTDPRAIGILVAATAATVGGAVVVALGRPLDEAFARRSVRYAVAVVCVVVAVAAIARVGPTVPRLLSDFRRPPLVGGSSLSDQKARFDTARSNRYQYWRIAYHAWRAHPLGGIGAGAFAVPWYRERTFPENTTDPHGWPFQLASEEGLLGLAVMSVFLASLVRAAVACRRLGGAAAIVGAAAASTCAYFFAHAAVDWLFSMSSVYVVGMTASGALVGAAAPRARGLAGIVTHLAAAAAAGAALFVFIPTWASLRFLVRGEAAPRAADAVVLLNMSHRWNPLSIDPLLAEADIELTAGARRTAAADVRLAIATDPERWELWLELADAERALGHRATAARALARAHFLNPLGVAAP